MTPEETSLARLLVALPGFPTFDEIGGVHDVGDSGEGAPIWYANGLVWVGVDLVHGEWVRVPLLTHMGTAGILLGMLLAVAPESAIWWSPKSEGWCWRRNGRASASLPDVQDPALGIAVARALLAIGRCE